MNSFWTKKENDFWREIIEEILDTLYHEKTPDEINWISQYSYEAENMVTDMKEFRESLKQAGIKITNEVMANFFIYTEFMHINNEHFVKKDIVNMNKLVIIAAKINDILNESEET